VAFVAEASRYVDPDSVALFEGMRMLMEGGGSLVAEPASVGIETTSPTTITSPTTDKRTRIGASDSPSTYDAAPVIRTCQMGSLPPVGGKATRRCRSFIVAK
jgi:hypothetical protein